MTIPEARPEAVAVTEVMVEAAACALDPRLFAENHNPNSPFAGTLEQWKVGARARARRILEAAAQVRSAQDHGGEADDMIGEVERLRALLAQPERQPMGFHERHAVLHARAIAAEARAAKAVEVLRDLEWSDVVATEESYTDGCPGCGAWKENGHEPDCRLATLLSDHPAPEPGVEAGEVRRAALEEAAKVLEQMSRDYSARTVGQWVSGEARCAWHDGAKAIRALQTPEDGGRDAL